MGYSKVQARRAKQAILSGDEQATPTLDGTTTTYTIDLTGPASKITMQSSGTLAYTYAVSVNGTNFDTPVAVAANVIASYSTNNVAVVKITRTAGTGRVTLIAV